MMTFVRSEIAKNKKKKKTHTHTFATDIAAVATLRDRRSRVFEHHRRMELPKKWETRDGETKSEGDSGSRGRVIAAEP